MDLFTDYEALDKERKAKEKFTDKSMINTVSLRVTDAEYQKLKRYADSHGMTITQLLHTGVTLLLNTPDAAVQNLRDQNIS